MELTIVKSGKDLVVDSREVAKMVDKEHSHLLRDIRNYIGYIENLDLNKEDYFVRSSYLNQQSKMQPCYLLTKKGCDVVANEMTGKKGMLFTSAYINGFRGTENQDEEQLTHIDLIIQLAQQLKILDEKQKEQEERLLLFEQEQKIIKGKVDIINDKEYTIMGYANLHNIKLNDKAVINLGRMASRISWKKGYSIGSVTHPVFGRASTYHVDILDVVFDEL